MQRVERHGNGDHPLLGGEPGQGNLLGGGAASVGDFFELFVAFDVFDPFGPKYS